MSASQDKKKRTQQRADGTERRQVAAQKQSAEKKKERIRWTIGTILVVVLIAGILIGNSNIFYRQTALKVGDESFSAAQVNYYYNTAYQNWYSQYSPYFQYLGIDTSSTAKPIPQQEYTAGDEFETWGDYFMDSAKESIKQISALSSAAREEGVTLSDADKAGIDEQLQSIFDYAKTAGYGSGAKYLQAIFGPGVTEKLVRQEMERSILASNYAQEKQKSFTYTSDELKKAYAEHADEYDLFDGMYYLVAADTVDSEDENGETVSLPTDETMAKAKETADKIAAQIKETGNDQADRFKKAVAEFGAPVAQFDENGEETGETTPAEPVVLDQTTGSNVSYQGFHEWMFDSSRKAGDTTVIEQENSGYYVVLFQNRETPDYNTVNVRHILVKPVDADEDGTISEEEKAEALTRMEEVQKAWEDGEKTEDAFAALAGEYSEDPGSVDNGGLYENVYQGQMVTEFNDFCFAEGRKAGDVELIYSESTGYHLIYFVGEGMPYADYLADNLLRSEDFSAWQESMVEGLEAVETRAMKYVG